MKLGPNPTALRDLISYEPDTGLEFWKARHPSLFQEGRQLTADQKARQWNARHAGREALCSINEEGYKTCVIFGVTYQAHRVIWALVTGFWPSGQIDHENGNRSDNRISNLSDVSNQKNCRNRAKGRANKSGIVGVHYQKKCNKWVASIGDSGNQKYLGMFDSLAAAALARRDAEIALGYSMRHGLSQ